VVRVALTGLGELEEGGVEEDVGEDLGAEVEKVEEGIEAVVGGGTVLGVLAMGEGVEKPWERVTGREGAENWAGGEENCEEGGGVVETFCEAESARVRFACAPFPIWVVPDRETALAPSIASRLVAASGLTILSSDDVVKFGVGAGVPDEEKMSKLVAGAFPFWGAAVPDEAKMSKLEAPLDDEVVPDEEIESKLNDAGAPCDDVREVDGGSESNPNEVEFPNEVVARGAAGAESKLKGAGLEKDGEVEAKARGSSADFAMGRWDLESSSPYMKLRRVKNKIIAIHK
jgi:hypothetical protein